MRRLNVRNLFTFWLSSIAINLCELVDWGAVVGWVGLGWVLFSLVDHLDQLFNRYQTEFKHFHKNRRQPLFLLQACSWKCRLHILAWEGKCGIHISRIHLLSSVAHSQFDQFSVYVCNSLLKYLAGNLVLTTELKTFIGHRTGKKADVSSVSPLSELAILSHRRSTTVSLATYPLYSWDIYLGSHWPLR